MLQVYDHQSLRRNEFFVLRDQIKLTSGNFFENPPDIPKLEVKLAVDRRMAKFDCTVQRQTEIFFILSSTTSETLSDVITPTKKKFEIIFCSTKTLNAIIIEI